MSGGSNDGKMVGWWTGGSAVFGGKSHGGFGGDSHSGGYGFEMVVRLRSCVVWTIVDQLIYIVNSGLCSVKLVVAICCCDVMKKYD